MALLMSVCFVTLALAEEGETDGAMGFLLGFLDVVKLFLYIAAWVIVLYGGIHMVSAFATRDNVQKIENAFIIAGGFLFMALIDWVFTNMNSAAS